MPASWSLQESGPSYPDANDAGRFEDSLALAAQLASGDFMRHRSRLLAYTIRNQLGQVRIERGKALIEW